MNPEPRQRIETEVADFAEVLLPPDGTEPPVIVGGHAVNLWAIYLLSKGFGEMAKYLPFTSKDLDLVGTWELLERLHQRLRGKLSRSEPRSPVLGRFYEKLIVYFEHEGIVYWTMGSPIEKTIIINRCQKEQTYEHRLRCGTLLELVKKAESGSAAGGSISPRNDLGIDAG